MIGARLREARALIGEGRAGQAVAILRTAVVETPDSAEAAVLLGDALLADGQPRAACDAWGQAIAAHPAATTRLKLHWRLVRGHEAAGEPAAALAACNDHLTQAPDDLRALERRARLLALVGDEPAHIAAWRAVFDHPKGDDDQRVRAIRHLLLRRQFDAAFELAERLIEARPGSYDAVELAHRAATLSDRAATATTVIDRALDRAGDDRAMRARLLLIDGRADEALATLHGVAGVEAIRHEAAYRVGDYAMAADHPATTARADQIARARALVPGDAIFPEALFVHALSLPTRKTPATDTIVLVTGNLGQGGAERQVALTAAGIARRGVAGTTILAARSLDPARGHDAMLPIATAASTLDIREVPPPPIDAIERLLDDVGATREAIDLVLAFPDPMAGEIAALLRLFLEVRPRVIHLWQDDRIAYGAVAAILAGVPHIVGAIRNVTPARDDRRRWRRWLPTVFAALGGRDDTVLTANTQAGADSYAAMASIAHDRIAVIANGVDLPDLSTISPVAHAVGDGPVVGGVFRLVPAKRPDLWLRAAARVSAERPEVRFVICGDGPMRPALDQLTIELGLASKVHWAGFRQDVASWIAAMDVLLLASSREGLPNVLIEAQALGVPVVTADAGGAREAIAGPGGMLVADATPERLAAAVSALLAHPPARNDVARTAAERFGLDRMIDRTIELYRPRSVGGVAMAPPFTPAKRQG